MTFAGTGEKSWLTSWDLSATPPAGVPVEFGRNATDDSPAAVSPDGRTLALPLRDGVSVRRFDPDAGRLLGDIALLRQAHAPALSPDGAGLAAVTSGSPWSPAGSGRAACGRPSPGTRGTTKRWPSPSARTAGRS